MNNNKKVFLFDGTNLDKWHRCDGSRDIDWKVENGIATIGTDNIVSDEIYGDAMIHVEFRIPDMPDAEGQYKGNSGVFVHGCYEIQVLDSYSSENPDFGDCGAVYGIFEPQMNACKPALEWQTFDIIIRAPRFDENNEITELPRLTLLHNGLVIHNNVVLPRTTPGGLTRDMVKEGQLLLQDHQSNVSFRNIWLIHLS